MFRLNHESGVVSVSGSRFDFVQSGFLSLVALDFLNLLIQSINFEPVLKAVLLRGKLSVNLLISPVIFLLIADVKLLLEVINLLALLFDFRF